MRISDWSSDVCSSDLFGCVALEQADLGPRRIMFGKPRDLLEQFRPPMIVEPPRRERLLRLGKAGQHIGGEGGEIGRASCRERVCQYVSISVFSGSLKKKQSNREINEDTNKIEY